MTYSSLRASKLAGHAARVHSGSAQRRGRRRTVSTVHDVDSAAANGWCQARGAVRGAPALPEGRQAVLPEALGDLGLVGRQRRVRARQHQPARTPDLPARPALSKTDAMRAHGQAHCRGLCTV